MARIPLKCCTSVLKQEIVAAAQSAFAALGGEVAVAYLFFVFDGGNGYFYVYGGAEPLPEEVVPDTVFRNPCLVDAARADVFRIITHARGCRVIFADDEVAGHGEMFQTTIARR